MLQFVHRALLLEMKGKVLESFHVSNVLSKYSSGVSHNTIRRHLNVLINEAILLGKIITHQKE